jgi:GMP synthase-like glutamine amidotransferase
MTRALVLRHHAEDHSGLIGEAFESRGFELDLRMMNEASATPSLDGYDVFVILGSKSAVYDKEVEEAWFGRELELIGEAVERGIPIFGICFGAQALCLYHGGVVERSPQPEIGWYDVDAHNDSGIASGPWFEFHFDHCTLPENAQLWKSITCNCGTGSPAVSRKRASLASTLTRSSSKPEARRPPLANARRTSSTSFCRTSAANASTARRAATKAVVVTLGPRGAKFER